MTLGSRMSGGVPLSHTSMRGVVSEHLMGSPRLRVIDHPIVKSRLHDGELPAVQVTFQKASGFFEVHPKVSRLHDHRLLEQQVVKCNHSEILQDLAIHGLVLQYCP